MLTRVKNTLHKIYYDTKNPASFSSVNKLYDEVIKKFPSTTLKDVGEWLSTQITYTLHKPSRKNFLRNKIIVGEINEQWEADLVDMKEFSKENDNYNFILTVIDVFSKYAFVVPLKQKTAN